MSSLQLRTSSESWDNTPQIDAYLTKLHEKCKEAENEDPVSQLALKILHKEPLTCLNSNLELTLPEIEDSPIGKLSLAHLAGIIGDFERCKQLHEQGILDISSVKGNLTPCHFAALKGNLLFLQQATRLGSNINLRSTSGYSAVDIFETIYPDQAKKCPLSTVPDTIQVITPTRCESIPIETAEETYHFVYSDRVCMPAALVEKALFQETTPTLLSHKTPSSALALTRIRDWIPSLTVDPGLGVMAARLIRAGDNLGSYSGLLTEAETSTSDYQLSFSPDKDRYLTCDAEKVHNLIPLVADGFPCTKLTNEGGYPHLIALRDIEPGEWILWDYGNIGHPVKWMRSYIYLNDRELTDFLKSLSAHIEELKQAFKEYATDDWSISLICKAEQIAYIMHTPHLIIDSWLNGKMDLTLFNDSFLSRMCHFAGVFGGDLIFCIKNKISPFFNTPEKKEILRLHLDKKNDDDFRTTLDRLIKKCDTSLTCDADIEDIKLFLTSL